MNYMWIPFGLIPIIVLVGHAVLIVRAHFERVSIKLALVVELVSVAFFVTYYFDALPEVSIPNGLIIVLLILIANIASMILTLKKIRNASS